MHLYAVEGTGADRLHPDRDPLMGPAAAVSGFHVERKLITQDFMRENV